MLYRATTIICSDSKYKYKESVKRHWRNVMQTTKNRTTLLTLKMTPLIYRIIDLKTKPASPDLHGKSKDNIRLITPLWKNVTFA